jgi:hypothetical protein
LGQLVQGSFSYKSSYGGEAFGIRQQATQAVAFIVHRFKLDDSKNPLPLARTALKEEGLAVVGKGQAYAYQKKYWAQHHKADKGSKKID